ncbi:hypothetical protein sphantq_02931 [Sphingobium sp. AntQ-1]|uniref:hypothetical protein n=1 Tax=Sphingobium sp. AntQ-1 TaxID=2930091 RepID=UPI00234F104A|nr:hypothetical protein [Sphingobium sp. AntQ-1]WCP14485.1 hypothetical protein sphantq_02931 [Sphingobium sp. AntQ-1]
MDRIFLSGLMEMQLRDGRNIRLCDGGFLEFGGNTYRSSDPDFGTIGSMEAFSEGVGDSVPAFKLTFLPASTAAASDISAPGMQGSIARFWIAEVDADTGLIIGDPDLMFDGQIDQTILRIGKSKRELDIDFVSTAERLFSINEGNSLNPRFHKVVNPGELGEDNATGLGVSVAWGVEAQGTASLTGLSAARAAVNGSRINAF